MLPESDRWLPGSPDGQPQHRRLRAVVPTPRPSTGLERRTAGDTDLSIFTTALPYMGRHRRGSAGSRLRSYAARGQATGSLKAGLLGLATVLALGACSTGSSATEGGQVAASSADAGSATSLKGVCPATVVIQSSWLQQIYEGYFCKAGRGESSPTWCGRRPSLS